MQFQATRSSLHSALQTVSRAVSGKSTLPILSNLHLLAEEGGVTFTATDLEIGIRATCAATVQEPGVITVPAKHTSELVSALGEGDVRLSVDDRNTAVVKAGRSTHRILGLPAEEFPPLPEVGAGVSFNVAQRDLYRLIRSVLVAASQDDTRPILTGVSFSLSADRLIMVATDTHRLALRTCRVEEPEGERSIIVPSRALTEVLRVIVAESTLMVTVRFDENQISFDTGSVSIVSRLIDGQFPRYEKILPTSHTTRIIAPVSDLQQATRRAALVAREGGSRLVMRAEGTTLTLTAQAGELGNAEEPLEIALEGNDIETCVNCRLFQEILGVIEGDSLVIEATLPERALALKPLDDDSVLMILMPMRIE